MSDIFAEHLARVKSAINFKYDLTEVPEWIVKNTFLGGTNYSFEGHEYQLQVLSDLSPVVNTMKCSQIGMSEAFARWMLGVSAVIPYFSTINTFPFSGDAENFCRTRIDPVVRESKKLQELLNSGVNNTEIKQIGMSFLYFRGTNSETAALSIPADAIISDEIDRSDPHILTQYESRLTHSKWRLRRNISTPTSTKRGIAAEMKVSRRYVSMCKCNHCNEWFRPDYFKHVKVPGFDGDLRDINKYNVHLYNVKAGRLLCPRCGREPSLLPRHRAWVLENPGANHDAAGYMLSPFDAPTFITVPYLLSQSTKYKTYTEFVNQNLGQPEDNADDVVTEDHVRCAFTGDLRSSVPHCLGADMGKICHIVIGRIAKTATDMSDAGTLLIVHRERVPYHDFERRAGELIRKFRVLAAVVDAQPYLDIVRRMQATYLNLYGAYYTNNKGMQTFLVQEKEVNKETGEEEIRQVKVNRSNAMESAIGRFRYENAVKVMGQNNEEDEIFVSQVADPVREVRENKQTGRPEVVWSKSADGNDHYAMATTYLGVACEIQTNRSMVASISGVSVPLVSSFKLQNDVTLQVR